MIFWFSSILRRQALARTRRRLRRLLLLRPRSHSTRWQSTLERKPLLSYRRAATRARPRLALISSTSPAVTNFVAILWAAAPFRTRRSGDAAVLALGGSAEHHELRVGELNGHGYYPSSLGARPIRPLTRTSPGSMRSTGRRVSVGRSWPRGRPHTRSLSKGMPVLSAWWRAHLEGEVIKLRMCEDGRASRAERQLLSKVDLPAPAREHAPMS